MIQVNNPELVIVRGINSDWMNENFTEFCIYFGGAPHAIPKEDAFYVGLYIQAPVSKIAFIGIVDTDSSESSSEGATYYLKSIISLSNPIDPGHPIRKHENWKLQDFGLTVDLMNKVREQINIF